MRNVTPIRGHRSAAGIFAQAHPRLTPEDVAAISMDALEDFRALGVGFDASDVGLMVEGLALDAAPDLINGGQGTGTPVEFLRTFLPGVVGTLMAARTADQFVGVTTAGSWEDEEVVQETMELAGLPVLYGDSTNIPLASFKAGYMRRGIVRFELGMSVGNLEAKRGTKQRINVAQRKRTAIAAGLSIQRNLVAWYGYNAPESLIYGILNDPNLPAYATVAATGTGSGTAWSTKDFNAITGDLRESVGALVTQMAGNFNPKIDAFTIGIGTTPDVYLSVTNDMGAVSVSDWITRTWPKARIVTGPELDGANGGANVLYVYPDRVVGQDDGSDDNGRVFDQVVPAAMQMLGVEPRAKSYVEDYTNATAGVFTKRPFAVVRRTGI